MKDVNDMSRKEVVDEMTAINVKLELYQLEHGKAYEDDDLYDRFDELQEALIHNFPQLIGGKDRHVIKSNGLELVETKSGLKLPMMFLKKYKHGKLFFAQERLCITNIMNCEMGTMDLIDFVDAIM